MRRQVARKILASGKNKAKCEKTEERTLHPLGPLCRQRRRHDRTSPLTTELLCADGGDLVNERDAIPFISLPETLFGGRCRGSLSSIK